MSTPESPVDALIIGAGPAGLTAALAMARQRHPVIVFDSSKYRNDGSQHMHTVLTWDHQDPESFRAAARENILNNYSTVTFENVEVASIAELGNNGTAFCATDADGKKWYGRKVVLASGVQDIFPDIEGYGECWISGIFQCLFCHGYEQRGAASSGILATDDLGNPIPALHFARSALQFTPRKVTIYTNGDRALSDTLLATISASSIPAPLSVDSRPIKRLSRPTPGGNAAVTLHFEDGTSVDEGFLGHRPKCQLRGPFAQQLGLELTPQGELKTTPPFGQTSRRGVFAAGDDMGLVKIVAQALASGVMAAAGVTAQVQAEKWGYQAMV